MQTLDMTGFVSFLLMSDGLFCEVQLRELEGTQLTSAGRYHWLTIRYFDLQYKAPRKMKLCITWEGGTPN